ncbi:MAG: D-alanine--D-alanine ligase [Candidatus Wallbacteria bacterium HGW-Wallbacteria-1]|jgi:D-alanine-D-alanine ligase|uniref:D-alanine--D-alanine ligase n=1 Tax=Candidatus Wallbacteria bacterium HGW-Wallbacteria-1 TaxID=2013854 RepID=A0A2N1PQD1_9BACT|nr:MAG: D-alanine--D-alanine ligase [Candidatus Wallbacteria bacterium HGW-Wallbacteria-1]
MIQTFAGKKISVLLGGDSSEREVSLKSGSYVTAALQKLGYDASSLDIGSDPVAAMGTARPEVAVIMLHGKFGEGGQIQGLCECMGIPYTGSGVAASSMSLDKILTKHIFKSSSIPTPEYMVFNLGTSRELELDFPVIIKPACEGSSIGCTVVREQSQLEDGLKEAWKYDSRALVEKFVKGREFTVGLIGDPPIVLPVIEIIPPDGLFDYRSKYTKGVTTYQCPADIDQEMFHSMQKIALAAHNQLGCKGFSRVDFMVDSEGVIFALEVNTIPGMTETSLLPMAAARAGYDYPSLCEQILASAEFRFSGNRL